MCVHSTVVSLEVHQSVVSTSRGHALSTLADHSDVRPYNTFSGTFTRNPES